MVVRLALSIKSHPMWVRGLKLIMLHKWLRNLKSHPMWVRGLKLTGSLAQVAANKVAPYVGAWIETSKPFGMRQMNYRRTLCGCVD